MNNTNKTAEENPLDQWINDEFEQAIKRGGKQYAEAYCDGLNDGYNHTQSSQPTGKERAALDDKEWEEIINYCQSYEWQKREEQLPIMIKFLKENYPLSTDVGEQDEKVPRLVKWANDGFPPIDLSNEFNAVMELIRAYQSLTRK